MTANDSKSDFTYLNKLVDESSNTHYRSISKKLANADYTVLNEESDTNPIAPKFKVGDRVRITKYKNIFSKDYTENWLKNICD